jgi:hypothetical protein
LAQNGIRRLRSCQITTLVPETDWIRDSERLSAAIDAYGKNVQLREGQMVFPKQTDVTDMQSQVGPLLVTPFLLWAFMGDIWAAMFGIVKPLPAVRVNDGKDFEG